LPRKARAVYVTDRDLDGAEKVAQSIRDAGGQATALASGCDLEADWDRVMAAIDEADGALDVLVNNAGIAVLGRWTRSPPPIGKQNDVNLNSVFQGTQRAMVMMRRPGADGRPRGGSIINISSVAGLIGVPGCGLCRSKGGVRLLTKVVALEGAGDGIRCNTVHPGMIATNIQGVALEDNAANYDATMALIPMGYMGAPEDIANMNLFLASDEARYITGAEMVVDGGMTAR
jgi:NAD(P)-dependent dehydrogenase (short-subunit alcohol dehydrogenase family)